jgi:hypothetical protein
MNTIETIDYLLSEFRNYPEDESITLPPAPRNFIRDCLTHYRSIIANGGLVQECNEENNVISVSREEFLNPNYDE